MKKSLKVFAFACSFSLVLGLSSCSNGSDLDSRENSGSSSGESSGGTTSGGTTTGGATTGGTTTGGTTTGGGTSGTHITSQVIKSGLKFDFSNAKAIAAVDKENSGRAAYSINSRAATPDSSVDDSPLLKILEDGKFESALTLADNANLANIKEIYKSPLEGSNDIFIVFDGTSSFYDEQVTVDENGNTVSSNSVYKTLGQLVCIHEDNTIADILKIEGSTNPSDYWQNYLSLETDKGVMFDAAGNLYYMARKWNSSGDMSVVYKFDPKTNEITELTASVSGTNYSSFKITKDGKIIFVQGSRYSSGSSATFLRAIPVDDPNNFSNIYYSSEGSGLHSWVYDEKNEVMYYVTYDGLYKAKRSGNSFKTEELLGTSTGSELNAGRYFSSSYIDVADWRTDEISYWKNDSVEIKFKLVDDNGILIPENVVKYVIECFASWNSVYLSVEDVDIRFDVFKDIKGYEDIYNATKGLKNAEAIKALDTFKLRNLFYDVFHFGHGYYGNTKNYINKSYGYKHNFLADILYVKDSDTLLCNSDEPVNSSTEVKGTEYFGKNGDYYSVAGNISVFSTQSEQGFLSIWDKNDNLVFKKSDGSVDYSVILKDAFSICYTHGEKEFRLDTFKDDETYGALYSALTDEEALKWIVEDDKRLFWFGNALIGEWDGNKYVCAKNFTDLFFIKGTNEPAFKQTKQSVSYSELKDYTVNSDGSLWARYTNTSSSGGSEDKYFYFVQITDSDGCLINDFNEVNLPAGKVSQTIENDGALYMKYSLLNSNGGETGFHQIYKVNFSDGDYVNMFKNVPNNEKLEVISYSVGADRLYYSAVRGTSVENGVVSTVTNEYNPLEITKKLSAIYTF